ncbi:MAG TPA: GNAT family N-acetyltransferase [Dehalococcoidia bacterium]|nr:GNAT family N-acetyltransferase [Dehalococcoidia bacterium]
MSRQATREGPQGGRGPGLEMEVEQRLCYSLSFYREGQVVGRAQLHRHDDGAMDIVDLYVLPEHRGRGLGRAIVGECLRLAESLGARVVTAHTSPANGPAYRLFLSLGFRPREEEHHLEHQLA